MESIDALSTASKLAVTIQTTQMLLEQRQREVEELEKQWLHAKSQYAALSEELQAYMLQFRQLMDQADTSSRGQTSLIHLPEEIQSNR